MPDSTTCPRQSIKVTRKGRGNTHTEKYHLEDGNRIADYQTALALETAQPRHLSEAIAAADCTQQSRAIIFFSPFLVILRFKDRPMSHPQQQNKRAGCLLPHTVCPKDPPVTLRTSPSFFQRELTYCYLQSGCLSYTPLVSRYVARVIGYQGLLTVILYCSLCQQSTCSMMVVFGRVGPQRTFPDAKFQCRNTPATTSPLA